MEQLTATVLDQNGAVMAGAAVTWVSSSSSVASVSSTGLVTAVADGTATVTATTGSASGTASVTVNAASGGLTFQSVNAGYHSCGVTTAGEAYCWGDNRYGVLGDGTDTDSNVPVRVGGS